MTRSHRITEAPAQRRNRAAVSYELLLRYVRTIRPVPAKEPVVRFETPAGHQLQVDFAEFKFPWGKRYAFMAVLGYSRLLWLRFYERQDMRTLFRGLDDAFRFFGGVTREVLFDQMKAVITADLRLMGGQLVVNEEFIRFANHWGFRPRACRPYRAQSKGKVERPIAYVRDNFVYGRVFVSDAHLDEERVEGRRKEAVLPASGGWTNGRGGGVWACCPARGGGRGDAFPRSHPKSDTRLNRYTRHLRCEHCIYARCISLVFRKWYPYTARVTATGNDSR
jgi:hypothetical protein